MRKAEVQEVAQFYTKEDWDIIRTKLEVNAELTKRLQGENVSSDDFAKRMIPAGCRGSAGHYEFEFWVIFSAGVADDQQEADYGVRIRVLWKAIRVMLVLLSLLISTARKEFVLLGSLSRLIEDVITKTIDYLLFDVVVEFH
ncbi:hypothetical protein Tco_1075827, partial [Tanacetum coccineum]